MAHFNESWDLPPLMGSCYMYGPQQPNPEAWNTLMANRTFTQLLTLANDALFAAQMRQQCIPDNNYPQYSRKLNKCILLLEEVIKEGK